MTDRQSVNDMARIMAIWGGDPIPVQPPLPTVAAGAMPILTAQIDEGASTDAMKDILMRFNQGMSGTARMMDTAAKSVVRESSYDSMLRAALMTEETDDGAQIGQWRIHVKEGVRKMYDVIHATDGTAIAVDLTLYEAAYGLANALADGKPITAPIIRNILRKEEDYAKALQDAIHYKHNLKKPINESRRAILEDRYDEAKRNAAAARSEIVKMVGPLPF